MATDIFLNAVIIGIGATAFMDLIAFAQKFLLAQQSLNYALVGRWCGHAIQGRFVHRPISASQPIPLERWFGWAVHYLIGVLFALVFLAAIGQSWIEAPSLVPALTFGGLTVLAPFLILQPGMGAGLAARLMPNPNVARLKSFGAHLTFGVGLWIAATCLTKLF